jgi:hypothetical protein
VYFLCHDAPVLLYQAPSVGHFLHELFRMYEPPHASLVDDVHEDRLFRVWRENRGAVEQAAAAASDDEVLAASEATLDERFLGGRPARSAGRHGLLVGALRAADGGAPPRLRARLRLPPPGSPAGPASAVQPAARFTSALIRASTSAFHSVSANATGHIAPSSSFAESLKPNVA